MKNKSYYGLRDPQEKQAIETLRKYGEHAAPVLAALLAEGLKNRGEDWMKVYRPLYIMRVSDRRAQRPRMPIFSPA